MDKLEQFKKDFELDYSATEEQRDKSNEEYRFFTVPGGQWESFLEDHYENRSKLELDQTADYVYRTYGQWTQNRIGINYSPDDGTTTTDDAELINGIYRRDFRRNNGQVALDNAVLEAMGCGVGALHISTEYDDKESVDDELMNVVFKPVHNAYSMVAWDSSAKRIDKADAKRCTVIYEYSADAFEREYPEANLASAVTPSDRRAFNWSSPKSVFVACRYEVKREKVTAFVLINPLTGQTETAYSSDGDVVKEAKKQGFQVSRQKRIERQYVVKSLFYGDDFLEEDVRIPGKYIPIIPIYGYRAYIDGVEFYHGLVRKRMDAQRLFNMEVSLLAETAASSYKRLPLFDPRQVRGLENIWSGDLSKKNYMVVKPIVDKQGNIIHSGPLGYLEPPTTDENTKNLIELTSSFIGSGTGGAPQDTIDPNASGKAINAVLKRVDLNVQPVIENIATALKWAGEVYRAIAADIYSEPRTVKTVSEDQSEKTVRLMEVSMDEETGSPTFGNDLSKGRFEVVVDTGPQFETRREETVETLKDLMQALPPDDPYRPAVLGLLISNLSGPGLNDLQEFVKKDLILKGIKKPESDEEKAMLQQASGAKDPQKQLMEAAATQQVAEAESLKARAIKDVEDAKLKRAKAVEIADNMGLKRVEVVSRALAN